MSLPELTQSSVRQSLLATPARRRMSILAATAALMSFAAGGFDFFCPLWVVHDLGYQDNQWAQMRSLRFAGVLVGVILLGALSDRFGQRKIAAISLFGMAAVLAVLGAGWYHAIWLLMPIHGAFTSTVYVNLNTLTQGVSTRRQGLANTIYRSVSAAAVILAPIAVTWLAVLWHGYPFVLLIMTVILIASGAVLLLHPNDVSAKPIGPLRLEIRQLWSGYRIAFRQRGLIRYIHISQIWSNILIGVGAFATLRFLELGKTQQQVGVLGTVAGMVALLVTVGLGFFLDRISLRNLHVAVALVLGLASVALGLGDYFWLSVIAYVVSMALITMQAAPMSMWVSRAAGESTQTAAFSVHKILSALYVTVAMVLIGYIEEWIGMRRLFLYTGILGTLSAGLFLLLPEPPLPRQTPSGFSK